MGSGLNLSFYDPDKVDMVFGLEPAPEMVARAKPLLKRLLFRLNLSTCPVKKFRLKITALTLFF